MENNGQRQHMGYRVASVITAMLLLGIVVTLPFSVVSVVDDILGPTAGKVIPLTSAPDRELVPVHTRLHLAIVAIDEIQLLLTLRVSGHRVCKTSCPWSERVLFVSVAGDDAEAEGFPPSMSLPLPTSSDAVSKIIQLPIRGLPIHYPFDRYRLVLGVLLLRTYEDGRVEALLPDEARTQLSLSIQDLLPHQVMTLPVVLDPTSIHAEGDHLDYLYAFEISLERPRYLRILAVLLVLLIAAAAVYSAFLRPLHDLVVNSGALVLGVWGIRAILTPSSVTYLTAVDLALSLVIIFLLGAISVKALLFAHEQSNVRLLRRSSPPPPE